MDRDGNEQAGVRAPMVAAPLATYTGWNLRTRGHGAWQRSHGNNARTCAVRTLP